MVYVTNNNASYSIDVCLICYMHWTYVGVCFIIVFYIYYIFLFFNQQFITWDVMVGYGNYTL